MFQTIVKQDKTLNEIILMKKLSSGAKCYIIPKADYKEKQAAVCFDFGSNDIFIQKEGEKEILEIPKGTAHFLEHKLFEEEWGDAFGKFFEQGADANAFTDFNKTVYYFSCIEHFKENFSLLLNFVQSPYFPEESAQKEKGIITQEITMYDDDPNWIVFFNLLKGMYHFHTVKNPIAGSKESIEKIHAKTLEQSYEAFYRPENMSIICVGDFDSQEVFEQAEQLVKKSKQKKAKAVYKKEPEEICKSYVEQIMEVSKPLFHIGFKMKPSEQASSVKKICAMKLLFDILAGNSSDFYNKVYEKQQIEEEFGFEYISGEGYATAIFSGTSKQPEKLAKALTDEIEKIKKQGISKEVFERIRKKQKSRLIRGFNSIDAICMSQVDLAMKNTDILMMDEAFDEIDCYFVESILKECFAVDKMVLSVVKAERKGE